MTVCVVLKNGAYICLKDIERAGFIDGWCDFYRKINDVNKVVASFNSDSIDGWYWCDEDTVKVFSKDDKGETI